MIVSYHTPGYYAQVANSRLLPSLRALGLEHDVREVLLGGPWAKRTQFKAEFLQMMRAAHPGEDLLWVDCDAVIHRDPLEELRDGYADVDLAVHYLDGRELLSGTIWIPAASQRIDRVLECWRAESHSCGPETWDQHSLKRVVAMFDNARPLAIGQLPPQYCFIFDTSRRLYPGVAPVIEHFQASRQGRREVAREAGEVPA